ALGAFERLVVGRLSQKDRELLAAVAREKVLRPHSVIYPLSDARQDVVAGEMPVGVVDRLEVIHVEHNDGQGYLMPAAVRELLSQHVHQVLLVEEARETVPRRRLVDAALVLLLQLVLKRKLEHGVGTDLKLVPVAQWGDVDPRPIEESAVR